MVRKARVKDVKRIHELIDFYARKSEMLPRSEGDIAEAIRDFSVYEEGGSVLGCAALHIYSDKLAEIRSLAVERSNLKRGIGSKLVDACSEEAANLGIKNVFALTQKTEFFGKFGFNATDKKKLPQKIWSDCSICSKFADCDEVAYIKEM
jgi:amino-acid N-acetyltransferase